MYRMLPVPPSSRVLELCFGAPPILSGPNWPGECVACCLDAAFPDSGIGCVSDIVRADHRQDLPFAPASFDLVVCHRSLDVLIAHDRTLVDTRVLSTFIRRASITLKREGVFAICSGNVRTVGPRTDSSDDASRAMVSLSIGEWQSAIEQSGLRRAQSCSLLPSADDPRRLINTDRRLSRRGFRRELQAVKPSLSWSGVLLRMAVVELALDRHREASLLAWGHRS
jgi:hypothetical protein